LIRVGDRVTSQSLHEGDDQDRTGAISLKVDVVIAEFAYFDERDLVG
jgi:hypothetical protein